MSKNSKIYAIVFIAAFSSLAFEITLTRIFSISLWYHFAFMVISIAMLGLAASGTLMAMVPKLKQMANLDLYYFFLGLSFSVSFFISNQIPFDPVKFQWSKIHILYIGFYYITLALPFFFTGLIIASAFSSLSKRSGLLYGSDLLGAGAGSIVILFLIKIKGPGLSVFFLSLIVLITSLLIIRKKFRIVTIFAIILILLILLFQPPFTAIHISPYKEMEVALRYPDASHLETIHGPFSRIDIFQSPVVRFAPGLSLKYLDPIPEQIGISIDGDNINVITDVSDPQKLTFLSYLPSALIYEISKKEDVLILDPKGGFHVCLAKHYDSKNIKKVESNALLVDIIRKNYGDFSGNIYGEHTWAGMGRAWLKTQNIQFDIIDIPMMKGIPTGFSGLSEDYQLTVEAVVEYIKHLKPDGILGFSLYIIPPPRVEFRLLATILKAMKILNIKDPALHIVSIRSWGSICILAKRNPFKTNEIKKIKEFSGSRMFDIIYYPGIKPEEANVFIQTKDFNYSDVFKNIINQKKRGPFINNFLFDISPVYDDKPFFHYFLKFKNIKKVYLLTGKKWDYFIKEGYILPFILFQALILSFILVFLPAIFRKKNKHKKLKKSILIYFASLGIGFMFVEISLIQKCILIFGNPAVAVASVLVSLLVGCGIGSLLSFRFTVLQKPLILIIVAFLILLYSVIIPIITGPITSMISPFNFVLTFIFLMPIGFFLGIPFPMGIKYLGENDPSLIPWAWAVNGCFSVMGPVLAMLMALSMGFTGILYASAFTYLLAFLILKGTDC